MVKMLAEVNPRVDYDGSRALTPIRWESKGVWLGRNAVGGRR
jgi:hypothetical protein